MSENTLVEQGTTNDMDEGKKRHPPAAELLNQIRGTIRASNRALYMNFEGVDPESGSFIAKAIDLDAEMDGRLYRAAYNSLDQVLEVDILKGAIHYVHQSWLSQQLVKMATHFKFITKEELNLLGLGTGSVFTDFSPLYTSSVRAPDQCITQRNKFMPNVVVESTWIANRKRAHEDMSMWLKGSSETTQLVILFEWEDIPCNGVKADVGVYNLDAEGNVNLLQSEALFPAPSKPNSAEIEASDTSVNQVIRITRGQIFGSSLPAGRDSDEVFGFSLDDIRDAAREALYIEGRTPAQVNGE